MADTLSSSPNKLDTQRNELVLMPDSAKQEIADSYEEKIPENEIPTLINQQEMVNMFSGRLEIEWANTIFIDWKFRMPLEAWTEVFKHVSDMQWIKKQYCILYNEKSNYSISIEQSESWNIKVMQTIPNSKVIYPNYAAN